MDDKGGCGFIPAFAALSLSAGCRDVFRTAEVCRAGVVEIGAGTVLVNQDNLVDLAGEAVDGLMPEWDTNGKFAARVTLRVELLGEQRPEVAKRLTAEGMKTEAVEEDQPNA